MRCSWFISLTLFLLAGCVSIKPHGVTRDTNRVTDEIKSKSSVAYQPPLKSQLFRAEMDIRGHHLTGMFLVKRMTPPPTTPQQDGTPPPTPPQTGRGDLDQVYRVAFVNEVGITFFDVELQPDSFRVVSAFPSLNKKSLFRILETDLRVLLMTGPKEKEQHYRQEGNGQCVIYARQGKFRIWQSFTAGGDTLLSTSARSNLADPVLIGYSNYSNGLPRKITLENPVVRLKLSLRSLNSPPPND